MTPDEQVEQLLRSARTDRFRAGFSTRVLQRTEAWQQRTLGAVLQRYFVWVVPAAVTAIAVLAVLNARATHSGSRLDAVLALPTVTLDAAYAVDASSANP